MSFCVLFKILVSLALLMFGIEPINDTLQKTAGLLFNIETGTSNFIVHLKPQNTNNISCPMYHTAFTINKCLTNKHKKLSDYIENVAGTRMVTKQKSV